MARVQTLVERGGMIFDFLAGADDQLGGRRGRGGAEVGNKVDDGEVGFVADGGDHGDLGRGYGARQGFVIEGGQVFGGAAAARDDNHVDVVVLVEETDSCGDLVRGRIALHLRGIDQDIHRMMAALRERSECRGARPPAQR